MTSNNGVFPDQGIAGFVQTLGMLRDPNVQEFVQAVREREDLQHPEDRQALERNMEKHGLDDFAEEAETVAAKYWVEVLNEDLGEFEAPEEWSFFADAYKLEDPGKVVGAMLRFFGRGIGHAAKETARVISRYIVAGFMEVPGPIGLPGTVVSRFPVAEGEHIILAMITPFSDLKAVIRRIKELHAEMFVKGKRNRLLDKGRETLWLRYCAHVAGHDEEVEAGRYRYLAELHFELHPKDKPPGQPLDEGYEKALEKHAWRIAKNCKNWEKYRERYDLASGKN